MSCFTQDNSREAAQWRKSPEKGNIMMFTMTITQWSIASVYTLVLGKKKEKRAGTGKNKYL